MNHRMAARRLWLIIPVGLLFLSGLAVGVWHFWLRTDAPPPVVTEPEFLAPTPDPQVPDLRVTFNTPFRNVKPGVHYLGDASCAGCHPEHDRTYHAHPMGRSAEYVTEKESVVRYDATSNLVFKAQGFELQVEKKNHKVRHLVTHPGPDGKPLPAYAMNADVAIGSGTRGKSYLAIEGTTIWQTPISWFSEHSKWDLSPGFQPTTRRATIPKCLQCHVDQVDPLPSATNTYKDPPFPKQLTIGCERCHGPGELHVAERTSGKVLVGLDTSIVNPRHLDADLRMSVCQQCHLQGKERIARRGRDLFDYRPGLPWEQFASVFVTHPDLSDYHNSVGQFEQMEVSQCFQRSQSKLDCTSCHDPHKKPNPNETAQFYRERCLKCHERAGCSETQPERQKRQDNCTACHMPKADSSNVVHASVTDHRILRKPTSDSTKGKGFPAKQLSIVPYRSGKYAPESRELERDYGIVLSRFGIRTEAGPAQDALLFASERRLKQALTQWPGDAESWDSLGALYLHIKDMPLALDAVRKAVSLDPESDLKQSRLVSAAMNMQKPELALHSAQRVIQLNPRTVEMRLTRSLIFMKQERWSDAEQDCREAISINPLNPQSHLYLAACRHNQGDQAEAKKELEICFSLAPIPQAQHAYMQWFNEHTR